jgi:DnaJ family protein C protein 1
MKSSIYLTILFSVFSISLAWDQSELEIFDLVEEINQNFYDLLGVPQVGTCIIECSKYQLHS